MIGFLERLVQFRRAQLLAAETAHSVWDCTWLLQRHHVKVAKRLLTIASESGRNVCDVEAEWLQVTENLSACLRVGLKVRLQQVDPAQQ